MTQARTMSPEDFTLTADLFDQHAQASALGLQWNIDASALGFIPLGWPVTITTWEGVVLRPVEADADGVLYADTHRTFELYVAA